MIISRHPAFPHCVNHFRVSIVPVCMIISHNSFVRFPSHSVLHIVGLMWCGSAVLSASTLLCTLPRPAITSSSFHHFLPFFVVLCISKPDRVRYRVSASSIVVASCPVEVDGMCLFDRYLVIGLVTHLVEKAYLLSITNAAVKAFPIPSQFVHRGCRIVPMPFPQTKTKRRRIGPKSPGLRYFALECR